MSLSEIQDRIAKAEQQPGSTRLIAVSKVQPIERVVDVLKQGHRVFGENKVQEAAGKWPDLKAEFEDVELHLIGPLQSNKTRQAMALFDVIQSLDRPKLARAIARIAGETGHCPDLFVQVNTGEESQKAGVLPADLEALLTLCRELSLPVIGLMCIPPAEEEPSLHFALLAKLAKRHGLARLSMGMSDDFERAIAQGATHIRVGSALFGQRDYG